MPKQTTMAHGPSSMEQRIYEEQVSQLYANSVLGQSTSLVNSAVLAYILWPVIEHASIVGWLIILWGVTALRYLSIRRYRDAREQPGYDPHFWGRLFIAGMGLTGLVWGSTALFLFPEDHLAHQMFIAFVLGGMGAGSAGALAMLHYSATAFILCSLVPMVGRLFYANTDIQYAMAFMLTLFAVMMLVFARRTQKTFVSSIRLRFEKSSLSSDLAREVTVRTQAEASLRDSEVRLRTVVDNAPVVLFAVDKDGTVTLSEGKGLELLGLQAGEIVGRPAFEVFHSDPAMTETLQQALAGVESSHLREVNGRFLDVRCSPLLDEKARVIGVIGVETDITDKHKMESMKRDFISTVSHELRTPLTSIYGALELIASGKIADNHQQLESLLEIARRNSTRLIRLVNDILDIDKLESGKMPFRFEPALLPTLLSQALEANRAYAEQFKVNLALDGELPPVKVKVDEDRFLQVMANLLSNAIKHSPANETVRVRVKRLSAAQAQGKPPPKPMMEVSVIDRGPGIAENYRVHIFDKFVQVDADRSLVQGGTGLGLSIAKAIVEQHGGEIGLEIDESAGETRFFFTVQEWLDNAVADTAKKPPHIAH